MSEEFLRREVISARVKNIKNIKSNQGANGSVAPEKRDSGFRRFSQTPLAVRELGEASATDRCGAYRQMLYKVQGHLNPLVLKEAVQTAIDQHEILRSSFYVEQGMLCQAVFPQYETPDILCWDHSGLDAASVASILAAAMNGDMRQGLGADEIFRISAYQTAADVYAVLVTAENILAENFDFRSIWADTVPEVNSGADNLPDEKEAKAYWDSLPPAKPSSPGLPFGKPGAGGNLKTYRLTLPPSLTRELCERTAGERLLLAAALATAWGLMLNGEGTLAFSAITEGKATLCPLLLSRQTSVTENLVKAVKGQLEASPRFAFVLPQCPCDSILSFADFCKDGGSYADAVASPAGQLVLERLWSPQNVPLSLYFTFDDALSVFFLYESERFKPFGVELLAKRYLNALYRLSRDFRQPLFDFTTISYREEETPLYEALRSSQRVFDLLSASSLLAEVPKSKLPETLGTARLVNKLLGDRIIGKELEQNIIYLAKGKVSVSLFDSNGWCNVLGLKKDDAWLNESILLPHRNTKLALEIVSDEADLAYIPLSEFQRLLYDEPVAVRGMLLLALTEMEKYQKLWAMM